MDQINHFKINQKKAEGALVISDNVFFKVKNLTIDDYRGIELSGNLSHL